MVQAPTDTSVMVEPDTVQTPEVVEAKLTARPDDAVPLSAGGVAPNAAPGRVANVMVWLPASTWKLWFTGGAAAQLPPPPCVAWMVQVPTDASVMVEPDTVQTPEVVEAKLTPRPEEAVALSAGGVVPIAALGRVPKVMVWLPGVTWKIRFTGAAAAQLVLPAWVA